MQRTILLIIAHCVFSFFLFGQQEESAGDSTRQRKGLAYLPIIYYTPETKLAFGGGTLFYSRETKNERPSTVTATLVYTLNKQIIGEVTTGLFFQQERYWHTGNFYYELFPFHYYGIGNNTPDSAKEKFTLEVLRLNPSLLVRVSEKLFIGPLVHFETWHLKDLETGRSLSFGTIPGSKPTTVTGIGVLIYYDQRDNLFAATSGRFYQASFIASPEFLGSTFGFTRLQLDAREFFPLGGEHVISVQALLHTTTGTVPFGFLPKVGGQYILRGYFEGRYRDNHMAAVQTEYRTPLWNRFGFAVFGGIGDVTDKVSHFSTNTLKTSFGVGLRFNFIPEEKIILRCDYGIGKNSNGVYITFNEAI